VRPVAARAAEDKAEVRRVSHGHAKAARTQTLGLGQTAQAAAATSGHSGHVSGFFLKKNKNIPI